MHQIGKSIDHISKFKWRSMQVRVSLGMQGNILISLQEWINSTLYTHRRFLSSYHDKQSTYLCPNPCKLIAEVLVCYDRKSWQTKKLVAMSKSKFNWKQLLVPD